MSQTKHQIESLLADAGMAPRHRFGQNFMIDQNLVRLVADAGEIQPGELVIEVGPGTGTLTEEILARSARLVAVEIDRDLAALLRQRFAGRGEFQLIEGDALSGKRQLHPELLSAMAMAKGQPVKLVANLPYNIASPLIIELLIAGADLLAFTVQKEVADRLRAPSGSEAYGILSVMAQLLSEVELLRTLPPQAFWPAPKIESALVRMRRRDRLGQRAGQFSAFVHQLFAFRRKMLRKSPAFAEVNADVILGSLGLNPRMRPEELTAEQCLAVFQAVGQGRGPNDQCLMTNV